MTILITVFTIFVAFFISSTEADCSAKSWTPVHNFAVNKVNGRWYAVLRFANGENDTSDCLWLNLKRHRTIPNALQENVMRTFKNGNKSRRRHEIEGVLTAADPKSTDGVIHVVHKNGSDVLKYITYADYDDFVMVRSCFEEEDYFWVYTRNQFPSTSTFNKIYEEIDSQGIDRSLLVKSCTGVKASDIV